MSRDLIKICERQELAEMIYMRSDGTLTKRRIQIVAVYEDSFKAYCFLRRGKRTFRIDRVLSAQRVISRKSWAI